MRIVAGVAGGRRLAVPAGRRLRPTTERVRVAMFSALESRGVVEGVSALDLFAGTGALGIEALSRGAREVTFVEADAAAVRTIRSNLATVGLAGGTVVQADVWRFLEGLAADPAAARFDLTFADPPYAFDEWERLLALLPPGLAALESGREIPVGPGWEPVRPRRYGDTVVTLARRTQGPESCRQP